MNDLSPVERLAKLRTLEEWLAWQLESTRRKIRDLEAQAVEYEVEGEIHQGHPLGATVHVAGCNAIRRETEKFTADQARFSLSKDARFFHGCEDWAGEESGPRLDTPLALPKLGSYSFLCRVKGNSPGPKSEGTDMTERHYTAWMTNDPSCVPGDFMDITVIEDVAVSYKEEVVSEEYDPETGEVTKETVETPVWESQGQHMFCAETDVDVREGDAEDGIREAEALMEKAGWKVVGNWEATDNSYIATVEYVGEYRHVIEATDNAEDPTWYEIVRGDQAEEHDDIPEEYGLLVLENYWPDNGLEVPPLADEYGNPYYRVLVRTQDDDSTLAVVESSAAGMTPAAFKTTREILGLSDGWLAAHLGVSSRTVRNWEAGKYPVPHGVAVQMDALKRETRAEVDRLVASLYGKPAPQLVTYRNDADYQAANPDSKFPASWHRSVVARAALQTPAAGIVYAEDAE